MKQWDLPETVTLVDIKKDTLIGDRILGGIVSGLLYTLPGWNLVALTRLVKDRKSVV
jgi:hypothetical protein